jgi:hypothetical protein
MGKPTLPKEWGRETPLRRHIMLHAFILAALFGAPQATAAPEDPMAAVQELYQYATQAVEVEAGEVRQRLAEIEQHLDSPSGEVARALEALSDVALEAERGESPQDG